MAEGFNPMFAVVDIAEHIASFMTGNDVSCNLRLVNKTTAGNLRADKYKTVHMLQPVPYHAFAGQWLDMDAWKGLTRRQRVKALCVVAGSGNVSALDLLVEETGLLPPSEAWVAAAQGGHLHVCEWLLQQHVNVYGEALPAAAAEGHQAVCEWLFAHGVTWYRCYCIGTHHPVVAAASKGHLDLMDWLVQQRKDGKYLSNAFFGPTLLREAVEAAAEGCDLATLQHVVKELLFEAHADNARAQRLRAALFQWQANEHRSGVPVHGAEREAATRATLGDEDQRLGALRAGVVGAAGSPMPYWRAKVEWLEAQLGLELGRHDRWWADKATAAAAKQPDAVERLAWLRRRGYRVCAETVAEAAGAGNVAALRYLLGLPLWGNALATHVAARGGHLGALQALHETGCLVDAREVVKYAVRRGDRAMLEWVMEALEQGTEAGAGVFLRDDPDFPLLSGASGSAGASGSLELMAWLHERGELDLREAFVGAAEGASETALEWLVKMGANKHCFYAMKVASERGDMAIMRCLRRLGCPWGPPNGALFTACVGDGAPLPLLMWLWEEGCPVDWRAAKAAVHPYRDKDKRITAWLLEQQ